MIKINFHSRKTPKAAPLKAKQVIKIKMSKFFKKYLENRSGPSYLCANKTKNTKIMQQLVLKENVLSDNTLFLADSGKVFKGNYIAIIREYGYQNTWTDKLIKEVKFRTEKALYKYLQKHYPEFELCY